MKLDDRPVIEQLLNPTPLNILEDVLSAFRDRILDGADDTQLSIDSHLLPLMEDAEDFERFALAGKALMEEELDRRLGAVEWFASELEARL
jgi:hypothetical protein